MRSFLITLALLIIAGTMSAQVAVKTNILYDATATINLGAEMKVAPKWSVDLSCNLNEWDFSNGSRWRHWMLQPEARYWLKEAMSGHFLAANVLGGMFNIGHLSFARDILGYNLSGIRDNYYKGGMFGIGVAYGYNWTLTDHWHIEAEIGLGYIYAKYTKYECATGRDAGKGNKNFFAPTKAAVNIEYVF